MTTAANAATATPSLRAAGQSLHRHVARLPAHPPDLRPGDGIGTLAATGRSGRILTLEHMRCLLVSVVSPSSLFRSRTIDCLLGCRAGNASTREDLLSQQSVTPPTRVLAGARRLDLDHPRSEVAEHHRCMLAGQRPGNIDGRNAIPTPPDNSFRWRKR